MTKIWGLGEGLGGRERGGEHELSELQLQPWAATAARTVAGGGGGLGLWWTAAQGFAPESLRKATRREGDKAAYIYLFYLYCYCKDLK